MLIKYININITDGKKGIDYLLIYFSPLLSEQNENPFQKLINNYMSNIIQSLLNSKFS